MEKSLTKKILYFFSAVFYLISAFFLYKGYDKMTNYYNSEYSWEDTVNAYVGGDAYNYIINGNYATGFFVLAIGFLLAGTMFILGGLLIVQCNERITERTIVPENNISDELPDLTDRLPEL